MLRSQPNLRSIRSGASASFKVWSQVIRGSTRTIAASSRWRISISRSSESAPSAPNLADSPTRIVTSRAKDRRVSTKLMIVPLYFFIERLILLIHNGLTALIQGLSLGLLSNEDLERLTERRYLTKYALY